MAQSKFSVLPQDTVHRVRDTCLCLHVQRAARTLARRFDEALRPFGVTSGQFSLLVALNQKEPPSIGTLAADLAMDRTTLTAALKPLERRGLVRVVVATGDRRSRRVAIRAGGVELLRRAVPVWQATHDDLDGTLPETGPDRLRRLLKRVT